MGRCSPDLYPSLSCTAGWITLMPIGIGFGAHGGVPHLRWWRGPVRPGAGVDGP